MEKINNDSKKGFDLINVKCQGRVKHDVFLDNGANHNNWTLVEKGEIVNVYDNVPYKKRGVGSTDEIVEAGIMHYIKKYRGRKFLCIEDKNIELITD